MWLKPRVVIGLCDNNATSYFPSEKKGREPDGRLHLFKAHFVRTEVCDNVNENGERLPALELISTPFE